MNGEHFYKHVDVGRSYEVILKEIGKGNYPFKRVVLPTLQDFSLNDVPEKDIIDSLKKPEISKYVTRKRIPHVGSSIIFVDFNGIEVLFQTFKENLKSYTKEKIREKLKEKSDLEFVKNRY